MLRFVSAPSCLLPLPHFSPLSPDGRAGLHVDRWAWAGEQQIGQEIGRGGFGTVFQALNTATGDFVAVKRMDMDSVQLDAGASIKASGRRRAHWLSVCGYLKQYDNAVLYRAGEQ